MEMRLFRFLSRETIIESMEGELVAPHTLLVVPSEFRDEKGLPLTLSETSLGKYMSHKYEASVFPMLERLGVTEMSPDDFLLDLEILVTKHGEKLQAMPGSWHSRLSQVLSRIVIQKRPFTETVSGIPIIPLRGGAWATANSGNLLFGNYDDTSFAVPSGIDIQEVDPIADRDPDRHNLFLLLGVRPFSQSQICDLIVAKHNSPTFHQSQPSPETLAAHAVFLFHSQEWNAPQDYQIWFATEDASFVRGCDVYLRVHSPMAAATWPQRFLDEIPFLHDIYLQKVVTQGLGNTAWTKWLTEIHWVNIVPRLASPSRTSPFTMSKEFALLMEICDSRNILSLMKYRWEFYSTWLTFNDEVQNRIPASACKIMWKQSCDEIRQRLGKLKVPCIGGFHAQLRDTVLPLTSLKNDQTLTVRFLDIADADNPSWRFLGDLGVGVSFGADLFFRRLRASRKLNRVSVGEISEIYRQLHARSSTEGDKIR
jgi:hypothetical protein